MEELQLTSVLAEIFTMTQSPNQARKIHKNGRQPKHILWRETITSRLVVIFKEVLGMCYMNIIRT